MAERNQSISSSPQYLTVLPTQSVKKRDRLSQESHNCRNRCVRGKHALHLPSEEWSDNHADSFYTWKKNHPDEPKRTIRKLRRSWKNWACGWPIN